MNGGGHVTAAPPDQLFLTDCQQAISPFKKKKAPRRTGGKKAQILPQYHLILPRITTATIYSINNDQFQGQNRSFWRFLWMRTAICKWVWLRKIWRPQPVWARHCANNPAHWIKPLAAHKTTSFFLVFWIRIFTRGHIFDLAPSSRKCFITYS